MFAVLILLFSTILYLYLTKNFDYWKKRGVKHDKPIPLFGNNLNIYLMKKSLTQMTTDAYRNYPNEKVVGLYRSSKPQLLIRDPEIVKCILATDFSHFYRRGLIPAGDTPEPLTRHLFNADGDLWRLLRQRLTPAFTSGKLKAMFPLIVERAERLRVRIQSAAGAPIDARDLMARFTTDFIGACGFGLDVDSLNDEHSKFRKLGVKIFEINFKDAWKFIIKRMFPKLFINLKMTSRLEGDIIPLVQSILKQRNYEPSGRNDFVDILLECKKKGTIVGESMENFKPDGTPEIAMLEMTDDLMAAQIFVFFVAGFETSSSTTSFTLHQLAYHPDIQRKVQDEIDQVFIKYNNKISYSAIQEMHFLEWAFKESMRLFPSVGFLIRECSRKYKVPGLDLTIDEGVKILIPVQALQTDAKYFENPEEFQPERFRPQRADSINKFVYLPFGDGPRTCIGARLGLMQSLVGLAAVLMNFTVEPAPSSLRHPNIDAKPIMIQTIKGGLPLLFRERKKILIECSRKYKVPGLDLTIDEGVKILIPVQALQTDAKYFENPEEFQPERFRPQRADSINKFVYLPFGDGPRTCIGARLGLMQSLVGLAAVLMNFTVEPAPSSLRHPNIDAKPIMIQTIKGGLPLLFRERKKILM